MWNVKFSDCLPINVVDDCRAWAKVFQENSLYIILYQLTKHQDKNFTSPDIKVFVFFKIQFRDIMLT